MIIVRIELHSARTGKLTELGRMRITNDGTGNNKRRNYDVELMRKGTATTVQRRGRVQDYPAPTYTIWELVRRALASTLGKWPVHPGEPEEFDEEVLGPLQEISLLAEGVCGCDRLGLRRDSLGERCPACPKSGKSPDCDKV